MPKPGTLLKWNVDSAYENHDPYGNYRFEGIIINPKHKIRCCRNGLRVRTACGKWANCHPPNGVNLKGAYGVRYWVDRDEWPALDAQALKRPAKKEPAHAFKMSGSLFDKWGEWVGGPCPSFDVMLAAEEYSDELIVKGWIKEDGISA